MNPKDIINSELICKLAKAAYHNDVVIYSLYDELLRRLNEADKIRKENESLKYCLLNTKNDLNTIMRQFVGREEYWPIQRSLKFTSQQIEFVLNPIKNTKESEVSHE